MNLRQLLCPRTSDTQIQILVRRSICLYRSRSSGDSLVADAAADYDELSE